MKNRFTPQPGPKPAENPSAAAPAPLPPLPPWPEPAVAGLVEITDGPIVFTPVPRLRRRRNGWTGGRQRVFIDALAECGCIARAARGGDDGAQRVPAAGGRGRGQFR